MNPKPHYVGNYMLPCDLEQYKERQKVIGMTRAEYEAFSRMGGGLFLMFIDTRKNQRDLEVITGRLIDNYLGRESTFEGELSKQGIKFTKRYSKDADVCVGELIYSAKKMKSGLFEGNWQDKDDKNWNGKFILWKPFDPSNN